MNLYESEFERTRELVQSPDWYLKFDGFRKTRLLGLGAIQAAMGGSIAGAAYQAREMMLETFAELLDSDEVKLGDPLHENLENLDANRQDISQIVIHHSSRAEGLSLSKLNAMHLLNIYAPIFRGSKDQHSIYSGHYNAVGRQVFYSYHWKVQQDGEVARLLDDGALAWHAGDYEVNKRSVGICIDDDLEHKAPTPESLDAVAAIIKENYPDLKVSGDTIIGHLEVSQSKTVCPGDKFIGGWKDDLLRQLS